MGKPHHRIARSAPARVRGPLAGEGSAVALGPRTCLRPVPTLGAVSAFGALLALGAVLAPAVARPAAAQTLTVDQWREDLAFLASSIRSRHPEPFHAASEGSFQRRVDELDDRIPELADHQILVEMAGIVAMLGDGHTKLEGGLRHLTGRYPLRFQVLSDGIFVSAAPVALGGALGARLLRLGETVAEDAYRRVAAVVSHDNEMTLQNRVPESMTIPEVLHALEITPARDRARFVLGDRMGPEFILDLAPVPFDAELSWIEVTGGDRAPLYLRRRTDSYWHESLEESGTLYVQYNRARDAPGESIAEYFARLSRLVAEAPPRRIVLDVRFNGGGADHLNAPVVEWVEASLPVVEGRLYLIMGRGTFSAGQKLVTRLDATTDVILVGEPSGGSPNHFGDAVGVELPNSGLTLKVSSIYHADAPGDDRLAIVPDIWAPLSSEDLRSGKDAALEAILASDPP